MILVEPVRVHRVVRTVGSVVLAGHGLVHLMGVALLWRWGRPGGLRYEDVHPTAGSAAGLVAGGLWLVVAVLFVVSAVLLVAGRRWWRRVALVGAVLSLAVLAPSASVVAAGIAVDVVMIVVVIVAVIGGVRRDSGGVMALGSVCTAAKRSHRQPACPTPPDPGWPG